MCNAVVAQVIREIVVEAGANVSVHRLQLDEDQREAVDEAHKISAPIVVGHAGALWTKCLHVVRVDALPAESIVQVVGEGLLNETILAVDIGDHLVSIQTAVWLAATITCRRRSPSVSRTIAGLVP